MTLQGRAASACPSSGPPRSYFCPAYSRGWPNSLGSVSRMQTRQHERLALNPKRIPLWAPSRGNMAVHTVRPAGTTRLEDGDSAGERAGFSARSCLRSERAVPGLVVRVVEPHCCQETSQPCAGNCWSAGGRLSAAGKRAAAGPAGLLTPRPWPRWTAALSCGLLCWVGRRRVGRADTGFQPLGPGKAVASQSLLLVGV